MISISYYYTDADKIDFKNKNLIFLARITSLKSLLIPNHLFLYSNFYYCNVDKFLHYLL